MFQIIFSIFGPSHNYIKVQYKIRTSDWKYPMYCHFPCISILNRTLNRISFIIIPSWPFSSTSRLGKFSLYWLKQTKQITFKWIFFSSHFLGMTRNETKFIIFNLSTKYLGVSIISSLLCCQILILIVQYDNRGWTNLFGASICSM